MTTLQQKVVAITGAGQGLGRAMAVRFAAQGAIIAAIDLNESKLNETVQLCRQAGGEGQIYLANVAQEESVVSLFDKLAKDFKQLHGVINNAGILRDGMLIKAKEGQVVSKMSLADWQSVIDVNLTGVFLCGREAARVMIEQQSKGVILNISSVSRAGNMGQSNYAAAKAGVTALTVTWSKELARFGIRVAGIAPGFIATEMTASMKPDVIEKVEQMIPLRRMGQPDEIAHTAQYIFENDYVTGRIMECDGGVRF